MVKTVGNFAAVVSCALCEIKGCEKLSVIEIVWKKECLRASR
jgi:hypothetical protein